MVTHQSSVAVINAQSQARAISSITAPTLVERRKRPRHGHIKQIEDVVYRVMREQARRAAEVAAPAVEAPPTLAFYSQATPSWWMSRTLSLLDSLRRLRPVACKFFCLFRDKQESLSLLNPAA